MNEASEFNESPEFNEDLNLEEELLELLKDSKALFSQELEDCETPLANCLLRKALKCISKLKTQLRLRAEWTSVKDELPKVKESIHLSSKVLVAYGVEDKQFVFGWLGDNGVWLTPAMVPFARQELITHWMPCPHMPE